VRLTCAGLAGACALLAWTTGATAAVVQAEPRARDAVDRPGGRLIDVPFLPQTEALCGGAAVAMVMRYWGARQIYPDDFAPLVDRAAAGIATGVLVADIGRRGWQAVPFAGDATTAAAWLQRQIDQARPVVALIEAAPGRYHYVVVVARTATDIVVHDPARAPFQTVTHAAFEQAWAATGRWAVLIVPGEAGLDVVAAPPVRSAAVAAAASTGACGPFVETLVALARAGDVASADAGLQAASSLCPEEAMVWRELAGIRFLQSRWRDAAGLAERAAVLEPADAPGWDLLATSRFLAGDPTAALAAWNRIEQPTVDVLRVEGAVRTRHPVIAGLVDLPPRRLLTAAAFGRASRRLQAMPSAALARLRYTPLDAGLADIEATVIERPIVPRGRGPLAAAGVRALLHRELRLDVAAPTGSGELWSVAWRWWEHRPRVAFSLAVPAGAGLPGVTTVSGLWERASYAVLDTKGSAPVVQQERRRAALGTADWATSWLHWNAGLALDRWADDSHASVDAGLEVRSAGDRVSVSVDAALWTPLGSGRRFATAGLGLALRSSVERARPRWSLTAGLDHTSSAAPFDLWSGAGTGRARTPLLRAHPLLDDGVVTGPVFGRRLIHGTGEYVHPVLTSVAGGLGLASFLDIARAWDGRASAAAWHGDAGVGLRVSLPGNAGGLRVDVARGLRDRRHVLSAAWQPPWPGRSR
jgi:hypothetical protein